jgi:hypothetical protein
MKYLRPLLVHIHEPKTGGTSLRHTLARFNARRHLDLYLDNTDFVYSPVELARLLADRPDIISISSHFIRTFPPVIGNRRCHYVTILRKPQSQFMSYIRYIKKTYANLHDATLLQYIPPNVPQAKARDFAAWLIAQADHVPFAENYTVNYLSWFPWVLANRHESDLARCHMSTCSPQERVRYRASRLELAKTLLKNFLFVGILEHIEPALPTLFRKCKEIGLHIPRTSLPHENATNDIEEDVSWLTISDEVGSKVLASQVEDHALYQWATEQFQIS